MVFGILLATFGILMASWFLYEFIIDDIVTICHLRSMKKRK